MMRSVSDKCYDDEMMRTNVRRDSDDEVYHKIIIIKFNIFNFILEFKPNIG